MHSGMYWWNPKRAARWLARNHAVATTERPLAKWPMQSTRPATRPVLAIALAAWCLASVTSTFTLPAGASAQAAQAPAAAGAPDAGKQLATIKQYCVACHNDRAKTAGVSFEALTPESIGQH